MRGAPVESLTVTPSKDRSFATFPDGEVDRACRSRNEWDRCRLASLPEDLECAMPAFEAKVLDVRLACLTHPQAVQPEQHRKSGVVSVERSAVNKNTPNSVRSRPRA
jgi:hypothetical protein